jgi:hypothetical protein
VVSSAPQDGSHERDPFRAASPDSAAALDGLPDCPECRQAMSRQIVAGIAIDVCESCRLVWFDYGEIDPVLRSIFDDDSVSLELLGPSRLGGSSWSCPRCLDRLRCWSLHSAPRAEMWLCDRDGVLVPFELSAIVQEALARHARVQQHDTRDSVQRVGRFAWTLSHHIYLVACLIAAVGFIIHALRP